MAGYNIANCAVCIEGCDTVDNIPNGTCPKFWDRPPGSSLCMQSWTCTQFSNANNRIVGVIFLLVALLYVRIIYYNYKKGALDANLITATDSSSASSSVFKRALRAWQKFNPRTHAR